MDEETRKAIRKAAKEKAEDLREFFADVKKSLAPQGIEASLNMLFLADACEVCFIDLERHKDFHRLEIADRHKRAAFLFKWLAKTRPVIIRTYRQGPGAGKAIHINAYFALMAALGELEADVHKFSDTKVAKHIYYAASYRDVDAENWALTFYLLEQSFPRNMQEQSDQGGEAP